MKEAEVSLRVALHYILEEKTDQDVMVSLDGAHIKTGAQVHFDVPLFLSELGWVKVEGAADSWQGTYAADGIRPRLTVCSQPGVGDVTIQLKDGRQLRVECKKGTAGNKSGSEYPLMREAIGQLSYQIVDVSGSVIAEGESDDSIEIVDGEAKMTVSLEVVDSGEYKLLINTFIGSKKADQPLKISGSWECDFTV